MTTSIPLTILGRSSTELRAANGVYTKQHMVVETDTGLIKTGDGATPYNSLPYTTWGSTTTAKRPSAVLMGIGARVYDTSLSKPVFSDGTVWRDAAGTAV